MWTNHLPIISSSLRLVIRGGLSDLGALTKFQIWGPKTIIMCGLLGGHGGQRTMGKFCQVCRVTPLLFFEEHPEIFFLGPQSQDLGLTSHLTDGAFYSIVSPSLYWGVRTHTDRRGSTPVGLINTSSDQLKICCDLTWLMKIRGGLTWLTDGSSDIMGWCCGRHFANGLHCRCLYVNAIWCSRHFMSGLNHRSSSDQYTWMSRSLWLTKLRSHHYRHRCGVTFFIGDTLSKQRANRQ